MPTPVTLKVFRGDELVRTERFTRDIIKIGRLSSAHLCLEDDRISRIHSVIEVGSDGVISIIDMGSAEGTFVNGKRVSKGTLRPGDEIKLGGLRVVLTENADAAPNRALDVPGVATPSAAVVPTATLNGHRNGHVNGHVRVSAIGHAQAAPAAANTAAAGP